MRQIFFVFAVFFLAIVDLRGKSDKWIKLENCELVPNPGNDGDSFHVRAKDKEYIFRLYSVDAPEVNSLSPERLVAQAKYFGITVPQAIELGENARIFVQEKLAEPFTVFTRMGNAMGHSNSERFYAFVQTKNGDLGEQLVANGLVRVYGRPVKPPGVSTSAAASEPLHQLENEAKQHKLGGWAANVAQLSPPKASPPVISPSPTSSGTVAPTSMAVTQEESVAPRSTAISAGKLDVNTATEKELRDLPGIGPIMAQRIIAARPFRSADDLKKVNGIGKLKYARIREFFQ